MPQQFEDPAAEVPYQAPRHSFRKDRMSDAINIPKNNYGHTVLSGKTQQEIDEEKVQVTFDAGGNRSVNMDIFDSEVMKQYVERNCNPDQPSLAVAAAILPPATAPHAPERLPVSDPKTLEEFDRAARAFLRGEDPTAALTALNLEPSEMPELAPPVPAPEVKPMPRTVVATPVYPATPTIVETADPAATRACTSCFLAVPASSKFCPECGVPLPPPQRKFCAECGYNYKGQEKFCPECGNKR